MNMTPERARRIARQVVKQDADPRSNVVNLRVKSTEFYDRNQEVRMVELDAYEASLVVVALNGGSVAMRDLALRISDVFQSAAEQKSRRTHPSQP